MTQDGNSQIISMTDNTNRSVSYAYSNNHLLSITNANNDTTSFTYDSSDRVQTVADQRSEQTAFTYTSTGQVLTITDGNHKVTTFTYNPGNTVVTDPNNHNTTYTYNSAFQVTQTTDALGHSRTSSFDALNYNVTQYGDALSDFSNFVFSTDGRNNLTSLTEGATGSSSGATTTFGYPGSGNNLYYPMNQKDPQGNQTNFTYDTNGNMLSATENISNKGLTCTYNTNGTVATQKDANGNQTTYGYDSHGNLSSVIQPSPLGHITLSVDALSRVYTVTDGKNQQTTYTYDPLDRVSKITYADSSTISYSYDGDGNVSKVTDNTGATTFQYDPLNRITQKKLPGGTIIATSYDNVGNLTSYNDGTGAVGYSYDNANRVTTVTEPGGAQTRYGYDNANRKISIFYPNSTGMLMSYDAAGHQLTSQSGMMNAAHQITTAYSNYSYSYQTGANQKSLLQTTTFLDTVSHSSTFTNTYSYDSFNRLLEAATTPQGQSNKVEDFKYTYDANSNMKTKTVQSSGLNESYNYNSANELTTRVNSGGTTTYSYDANGNQTGFTGGPTVSYNAENQATSVGSASYTYSGSNQNERVQVNNDTFVYGGLGLTSTSTSAGTTEYVRCSCGLLNSERTSNGQKYYYLFDGLGSIIGMTDSTGAEVNRYAYEPYGKVSNQQEQSGINNPWKFAGGYLDNSTGLYKYGIRYYDPTLGRWTQRTPVGGSLAETLKANPYVYADDDPTNAVDPSGKFSFWDCFWAGFDTAFWGLGLVATLATVIVTFVAPNPITAFFALIGVVGLIASARGIISEYQACSS